MMAACYTARQVNAKIFPVIDHNLTSVVSALRHIEDYRLSNDVGALALEPDERADAYFQELSGKKDYEGITLERAGHDIILVRYAMIKEIPLFILGRKNEEQTLYEIRKLLQKSGNKSLAAVLEESDLEKFKAKLLNSGYALS